MDPYSILWCAASERWKVIDDKGHEPIQLPLQSTYRTAVTVSNVLNRDANEANVEAIVKRIYRNLPENY